MWSSPNSKKVGITIKWMWFCGLSARVFVLAENAFFIQQILIAEHKTSYTHLVYNYTFFKT